MSPGCYRRSWHEARELMDRVVVRDPHRRSHVVPARVGVDQKAAGGSQDDITVVSNIDTGCAAALAHERRPASLDGFFERCSTGAHGSRRW